MEPGRGSPLFLVQDRDALQAIVGQVAAYWLPSPHPHRWLAPSAAGLSRE